MIAAKWRIVRNEPDEPLLIEDIGVLGVHKTITNDAEAVVEWLVLYGYLPAGRELLYVDSERMIDQIEVINGKFAGFGLGALRRGLVVR